MNQSSRPLLHFPKPFGCSRIPGRWPFSTAFMVMGFWGRFLFVLFVIAGTTPAQAVDWEDLPGVKIAYEEAPDFWDQLLNNEVYIGSPSITIMPNGDYIASHDLFGKGTNQNQTKVYRSTNSGQSWSHQSTITDAFWSTVFQHQGDLYLWGYREEGTDGDVLIRKSTDNGATWTNPTNSSNGFLLDGNYGGSPNTPTIYDGRLWLAMGGDRTMSAPVGSDLLLASSWTKSNGVSSSNGENHFGSEWTFWSEAQVVSSPTDGVHILNKVFDLPHSGLIELTSAGNTTFNQFVSLPGAEKKFGVQFDATSGKYYALSNPVLPEHANASNAPHFIRNTAAVFSSKDLVHWDMEKIFLYSPNLEGSFGEAFQYLNYAIDGDDLAVVSRTAYDVGDEKPERGHDGNVLTFHRIENFRTAKPKQLLVADQDNNRVMRYEIAQEGGYLAPVGQFTIGTTFDGAALDEPTGLVQLSNGDVLVGEQVGGGRILRFDASGNFKETVATEGSQFTGHTEAMTLGPDGNVYFTAAFGSNSDKVYKLDPNTNNVTLFIDKNFTGGSFDNPRGLAFGSDGNLYVADRDNDVIREFDGTTGTFVGNLTNPSTQPNPQALVWDETNNRLVYSRDNAGDSDIVRVTLNGSVLTLYTATDIGSTVGVETVDGVVYWADRGSNAIHVSTNEPGKKKFTAATGLNAPHYLIEVEQPNEIVRSWTKQGSGDWEDPYNWYYLSRPDTRDEIAIFGSAISGNASISLNTSYELKGLRFRDDNQYTLSGNGSLTLRSDTQRGRATIDVQQGEQRINLPLTLASDTDLHLANAAQLRFENELNLNDRELHITGAGELRIQGPFDMDNGTLITNGLTSIVFTNSGTYNLDGNFKFEPDASFSLTLGESFNLIDGEANLSSSTFDSLLMPSLGSGLEWDTSLFYSNGTVLIVQQGLDGDYNADGIVDAADYTVWRDNLGATEDGNVLNGNGDGGTVDASDYDLWRQNFGASLSPLSKANTNEVPEPTGFAIAIALLTFSSCLRIRWFTAPFAWNN